ncbi:E3 SUMO-protein ligase ZBED1-like isoform X1 [Pieris napi]|uniref:E3 SUMO-protein ligase ZBED1-like isoform X1 n=2 Tax=Pieris napi TaxID=78633 RepID=UPI001FBA8A5B|nr:E3 SUMO-protein ligase ZBED1-like isoform X1 [Pieris napi]
MSSVVWNFFKKIDRRNVSCNVCGKIYKTSGNTTNLSTHLKNKHHHAFLQLKNKNSRSSEVNITPITRTSSPVSSTNSTITNTNKPAEIENNFMELSEIAIYDVTGTESSKDGQSKDLWKQTTLIDMFERSSSYEAGGHKTSQINQALIYMICKDNMPLSCVEKSGLKRFMSVICPRYKIPSRTTITGLMEQRYATTKAILKQKLSEINNIALTSDILTLTNSTRSFIVVTAHFLNTANNCTPEHEMVTLTARRMYQAHTADYIKECFENITDEFTIEKDCILSITTDGGANMVAAVKKFLEDGKRIPCMAHLLNLIVDGATRDNAPVLEIANRVKAIVTYFKQSVNAMDDLRAEQEGQKKEGEVLTLIQSVSTRWNSCLDMLERFNTLSAIVAKILATRRNAPDMITSSELSVIRDLIILLTPFKQATEEISGDQYVTSSLAIPIANLLQKGLEEVKPFTEFGVAVQKSLLNLVIEKLEPLERHLHLAIATILDPRFKRIHFNSALAVSTAITALSKEIRLEHRRRGQLSPELRPTTTTIIPNSENSSPSLWSGHEKIMIDIAAATSSLLSTSDGMPSELKQYLDQPILPRKENPTKFWFDCRHFTPVLSDIALKYLISPASSVSSERVASAVNLAVPNNRSRLTAEHVNQRVFLMSVSDKYWFD